MNHTYVEIRNNEFGFLVAQIQFDTLSIGRTKTSERLKKDIHTHTSHSDFPILPSVSNFMLSYVFEAEPSCAEFSVFCSICAVWLLEADSSNPPLLIGLSWNESGESLAYRIIKYIGE